MRRKKGRAYYSSYGRYIAGNVLGSIENILLSEKVWLATIGVIVAVWKAINPDTFPPDVFMAIEALIVAVILVLNSGGWEQTVHNIQNVCNDSVREKE